MAALATLTDTFATISGATWVTNGTVAVDPTLGHMARFAQAVTTGTTTGLFSLASYDATSSSISAQVAVLTGNGLTNNEFHMRVQKDSSNYAEIRFDGTNLVIESNNAGVLSTTTVGTYNPASHEFWKISFASGTITFATSADGVTYTTAGTKAYSFVITAVFAQFWITHPSGVPVSQGYAWLANVNTSPGTATSITAAADPASGPVMNALRWNPTNWTNSPYAPVGVAQDASNPWIKSSLSSAQSAGTAIGFISAIKYALTGLAISARVVPGGGVTGVPYVQSQMQIFLDSNNTANLYVQSGVVFCATVNAGVATTTTVGPYSATSHAWWKIGEAGGNIIYSTSTDGATWVQVASHAHSFATTGGLLFSFAQSYPSGTMVGTSYMYVDMIGTTPQAWFPPTIGIVSNAGTGSNAITVSSMAAFADVQLTRNNFDGSFSGVRGASPFLGNVGSSTQVFTDYEAPIGVANSYTALCYVPAPDGTTMYSATVTSSAATITTPGGQLVWLKSLSTPSLSGQYRLSAMDNIVRPARAQVYGVVGKKSPTVVSDVQGGRATTLTFHVRSRAERAALLALMASGTTLFLQADSSKDGFEDLYFVVTGDSAEAYPAAFSGALDRTVSMAVTEVDSPAGASTAIPGNSWLLVTSFGTWSNVSTQRTTWQDVLNRPYGS